MVNLSILLVQEMSLHINMNGWMLASLLMYTSTFSSKCKHGGIIIVDRV